MTKKNTLKKVTALCMGIALTVGATGCTFLQTDNDLDLQQVVATVDITDVLANDEALSGQKDEVKDLIDAGVLATDVYKRDLVAYFISVGAEYVNYYGYTYEQVFNILMDDLTSQKVLTQYAVAYYLENDFADGTVDATADACIAYVNAAIEAAEGKQKELYQANKTVLAMEYFLTEGGTDKEEYFKTVYGLKQSFNNALDEAEASYIQAEEEEHDHGEAQTMPTKVGTVNDEYVPMNADKTAIDYDVYTGRNAYTACGTYEKVEGSTATTRKKAYNSFLSSLQAYGLIKDEEDTAKFVELDYFYIELSTSLAKAVANKYLTSLQDQAIKRLTDDGYAAVKAKYQEIYDAQEIAYTQAPADFESNLGSISDTAFSLYGYENFGFVYNILLPFDAAQEQAYAAYQNKGLSKGELFAKRAELLEGIVATDQRDSWFSEHDHAHYAYSVKQEAAKTDFYGDANGYLFFKDHFEKGDQYESLGQYFGKYAYNGTATKDEVTDEWSFEPKKLNIDGFMDEMNAYINFAVGENVASGAKTTSYGDYIVDGKVKYENFIYYEGKVNLTGADAPTAKDFFNKETKFYQAASAVNELMFAYSTDPGALNTYMGYAVSPYKTSFVPEFEAAAQYAIEKGVGTYVVAPSDYGWHIIFVTFKYEATGDVYGGFLEADVETEGTFSNIFYEAIKSTSVTNYTAEKQSSILNAYKDSTTLYKDKYQDLLDLDN